MVAATRTVLLKRASPAIDVSILAGVVGCWALLGAGCRSRAYEDVYQQQLQSEIRVLEDQLYEADYENHKLAEKLQRAKERAARCQPAGETPAEAAARPRSADSDQPARRPPTTDRPEASPDRFELDDDLMIDPGQPFDPDAAVTPDQSDDELMPAPGGPQPPGEEDLRIPPIEPGEPVPPPESGTPDDQPPGKIELDDALSFLGQAAESVPVPKAQTLRLQPGFSGGHPIDADDQLDGLMLVVSVIDDAGRAVDLSQFEITADLTVVALDPLREATDAHLARWELSSEELQKLVAERPVHGLHVPVAWKEKRPLGDQVAVHVRLRSDREELNCEATLPVDQPAAIAEWTARDQPK